MKLKLTLLQSTQLVTGQLRASLASIHHRAKPEDTLHLAAADETALAVAEVVDVLPVVCDHDLLIVGHSRLDPESEEAETRARSMGYDDFKNMLKTLRAEGVKLPFTGKLIIFKVT